MNKKNNVNNEIDKYFQGDVFRYLVYLRSYSRWLEKKGRRETWEETIKRYISFMRDNLGDKLSDKEYKEIYKSILKQEVMPSMRLLWRLLISGRVKSPWQNSDLYRWHEQFKRQFIGVIELPNGEVQGMSSTGLTTAEFCDFCTQVEAYAAHELGVRFIDLERNQ